MKKLSNLLAALVFVSLVIFIGCTSDSGGTEEVDPLQTQADLLNGTWSASANQVFYKNTPSTDGDWSSFALTISGATTTGGNYSVTGVPAGFEDVWDPNGGSWTWGNTAGTVINRGDVNISVVVSETALELSFDNTGTLGRTAGIEGDWKFVFTKN